MIKIVGEFIPQKTSDIFKTVEFTYGTYIWHGAIPKKIEHHGFEMSDDEISKCIDTYYDQLSKASREKWVDLTKNEWLTSQKSSATYKVLEALYSGEWECKVCGPVPKINPQSASRLRDLKKKGYIIGTQNKVCSKCKKSQTHDILVMLPRKTYRPTNELRKPMSEKLKKRIKNLLGYKEIASGRKLTEKELLIDHKFPSQRWATPESDNPDTMTDDEIRKKFQLLNNQSNTLKAKYCDNCVLTGLRGKFMDINWFYEGNEIWEGNIKDNENGCNGCPWYDLENWKLKLMDKLKET